MFSVPGTRNPSQSTFKRENVRFVCSMTTNHLGAVTSAPSSRWGSAYVEREHLLSAGRRRKISSSALNLNEPSLIFTPLRRSGSCKGALGFGGGSARRRPPAREQRFSSRGSPAHQRGRLPQHLRESKATRSPGSPPMCRSVNRGPIGAR